MRVGIQLIFQNLHEDMSDADMLRGEVRLAELAESYGFDFVGAPEHHFEAYSMCPDNIQVLTWIAARTESIKLLIAAAILPWHDPLRVAEKTLMLDHLSNGRVEFGIGRGLARMEYEAFRQDMNESRERFDESAAMILEALETGVIEGNGPFYKQPKIDVRPGPNGSFKDRLFSVAVSKDSVDGAADIGAAMMTFTQKTPAYHLETIDRYRTRFQEKHGRPAPAPLLIDFTYCHQDPDTAEQVVRERLTKNYIATHHHYDMGGSHFQGIHGYETYQEQVEEIRKAGLETAAEEYINAQIWGTPSQMIDRYRERVKVIGPMTASLAVSYGGMPFEDAAESLRLIGTEVLPELKKL
jgi:alkanesulfonate monooxygenase SsuD/methylene tetrahydromethanopterin reductase-like flavin-dependent oxidoreductase (luciferase family)